MIRPHFFSGKDSCYTGENSLNLVYQCRTFRQNVHSALSSRTARLPIQTKGPLVDSASHGDCWRDAGHDGFYLSAGGSLDIPAIFVRLVAHISLQVDGELEIC